MSKFLEKDKISFEKLTKSLMSGEQELEVKIITKFLLILSYRYMTWSISPKRFFVFSFLFEEELFGF